MLRPLGAAPAPCHHTQTSHQHGTRVCYVADKCRCEPWTLTNRAYNSQREREQLYGRWNNLIDAEPARAHVLDLMSRGMGRRTIANRADVADTILTVLLYGRNGRPPTKRVRPETARRLLEVQLDLAPHAIVDAAGTTRRLRALVALGWSQNKLAARLGVAPQNFTPLVDGTRRRVLAATHKAVLDLYAELSMERFEKVTGHELASVDRARRHARARGWLPPLAYDDDQLDMPLAAG